MTRLCNVVAIVCCLATSAVAEELVISHTRVALGIRTGGFQCNTTPGVSYNPSLIQANYCSLNTLTYTWGGRRIGMFDFNLSSIPEGAEIHDVFLRLEGVCCYGNTTYMELIAMPGVGYFNSGIASEIFNATGDIVAHPPTIPDPGFADYSIDISLIENISAGNNWLVIGIDHSGTFTNLAPSATIHVDYTPEPPCVGDLDNSGVRDAGDLGYLLAMWNTDNPEGDFNGDGYIDASDLGLLLAGWGPCP